MKYFNSEIGTLFLLQIIVQYEQSNKIVICLARISNMIDLHNIGNDELDHPKVAVVQA